MKAKCSIVLSLLMTLGSGVAMAQEVSTYSAAEIRDATLALVSAIEEAGGLQPRASRLISEMTEQASQMLFSKMPDKERFVTAAWQIVDRIEAAKRESPPQELLGPPPVYDTIPSSSADDPFGTPPFAPGYPPGVQTVWQQIKSLGLAAGTSSSERCDDIAVGVYQIVYDVTDALSEIIQSINSCVSCDPTGIGCLIVCIVVEVVDTIFKVISVPLKACADHAANIDSAEIEAAYENAKYTLTDLAVHDARIFARLDALEALMANIQANQLQIIRATNAVPVTPQKRRQR